MDRIVQEGSQSCKGVKSLELVESGPCIFRCRKRCAGSTLALDTGNTSDPLMSRSPLLFSLWAYHSR